MFQSLREKQQIYVLTVGNEPRLDMGTVMSVKGPYLKFQTASQSTPQSFMPQGEQVIDIVVSVNGIQRPFNQLPLNKEIADYVNEQTVISVNRDALNVEIDNLKNESERIVKIAPIENQKVAIFEQIKMQLYPEYAEKQRQEQEIATLKTQVTQIAQGYSNMESMMSKLLAKLEGETKQSKNK